MTALLERAAAEAWPALNTETVRGWTCRSAHGYTQRANSCLPLDEPEADLEARISAAEGYFAALGQPAIFKIPEQQPWRKLDRKLEAHHYAQATPSRVLSKSAANVKVAQDFRAEEAFDSSWWTGYRVAADLSVRHASTAYLISARVTRPVVARVTRNGRDVAWGFASLVGDQAWLFDVVVEAGQRRQGCGRELMVGLEAEAWRRGARTLYLQVLADNQAANTLYQALGFTESYRYHYRRQP